MVTDRVWQQRYRGQAHALLTGLAPELDLLVSQRLSAGPASHVTNGSSWREMASRCHFVATSPVNHGTGLLGIS
jgi:hypothetical protein